MTGVRLVTPTTVDEAIEHLASRDGDAALLAGGVAWMLQQARGLDLPTTLVHLGRIRDLDRIEGTPDGGVRIGAMATLTAVARSAVVAERAPGLVDAIRHVGTVRIRNQATIGGNVAAGVDRHDPPVMLLALGARLAIAGPGGAEREVPFEPWPAQPARRPARLITAIVVPGVTGAGTVAAYQAVRTPGGGQASAAVRLELSDEGTVSNVRLVLGDPLAPPRRSMRSEAVLRGRTLDRAAIAQAAELATSGGPASMAGFDHASEADRMHLLRVAARRALDRARERALEGAPGFVRDAASGSGDAGR